MSEEQEFIIVTDQGFLGTQNNSNAVLTLENTADANEVVQHLSGVERIDVLFPSFADGRGFSLAMDLRRAGYKGPLRAVGHLIADQYAHARRCGFNDIAISAADAERQPESQWLEQVGRIDTTYQTRLQQAALAV
ncbi:DUF934 domain-containing protein [Ahrensia kielensis]|uniref:DUF934 domain-containing protein n=1 Tax=Ahrensia kielensis TaxID=76980 RepID=A0ABU9T948_9HYPH